VFCNNNKQQAISFTPDTWTSCVYPANFILLYQTLSCFTKKQF